MSNPLVIPVGYAQCAIVWRRDGDLDPYYTTFGVNTDDTANTATNVALAVGAAMPASSLGSTMHMDKVIARVAVEGGEPLHQEASLAITGTISMQLCPPNVAYLWRKVTGFGGRAGRGRMYMPTVDETQIDSVGAVNPSQVTAENTLATNLLNYLADATHGAATAMCILHHAQKSGFLPLPFNVTGLFCDAMVATQRGRLRH